MKLGRAVEISPSVFKEQFTSCDKISQAASADSLLLSTLTKANALIQKILHQNTPVRKRIAILYYYFFNLL